MQLSEVGRSSPDDCGVRGANVVSALGPIQVQGRLDGGLLCGDSKLPKRADDDVSPVKLIREAGDWFIAQYQSNRLVLGNCKRANETADHRSRFRASPESEFAGAGATRHEDHARICGWTQALPIDVDGE